MRKLTILSVAFFAIAALSAAAQAAAVDYFIWDDFGGTWHDANKSARRSDDTLLCWAGAGSDILAYSGWHPNTSLDQAQEIFEYTADHWDDGSGYSHWQWQWWFNNFNPDAGWAQNNGGGGFFTPPYNFSDFFHDLGGYNTMAVIEQSLRAGQGTAFLAQSVTGHFIAIWGVRKDSVTGQYLGMWVTESDDNRDEMNPPETFDYYDLTEDGGVWHFTLNQKDWTINHVYALERTASKWLGGTASFHTASNWEQSYAPNSLFQAEIDGGTAQISANATAKNIWAGHFGTGAVSQSAGTVTTGEIILGYKSAANGTYTLSGGIVNATNVVVGKDGTGRFTLSGGSLNTGRMSVSSNGTLEVTNNSSIIKIGNGGTFSFAANTHYSAVTGAKIYMENNTIFDNRAISTLNLAGMNNTTFVYNGTGPASYSLFEIAGKNFGATQSGFTNNYALKGLYIGYDGGAPISAAQLRLINLFYNFDPQGPQSPEALYVNTLILGQGSTLDLNNLTVYALAYTNYGGTVLNGSITIVSGGQNGELVPEPLSAVMLAFSACASFAVLRRRAA